MNALHTPPLRSRIRSLLLALALLAAWGVPAMLLVASGSEAHTGEGSVPIERLLADEEEDESDIKDYWADVKFDRLRFREVLEMVRLHYIDQGYDRGFAYQRAANFALSTVDETLELLPTSYLGAQRKVPTEKKRVAGKTHRLKDSDGFVILTHVDGWNKADRRRMSDDEIRDERKRRKSRYEHLKKAWKDTGFSRADFRRVIDHALSVAAKKKERPDELWIAAAQGYLAALDPHSSLVSKEAWKASTEEIRDASFEGIGALLTQRYDDIIVESPIDGQPAARAGLRAGDVIVKVDQRDVRGKPLTKVVKLIRGPKGTTVNLTVQRVGVPEDLKIPIVRSYIAIRNITPRLLGPEHPELAYVRVRGFIQGTTDALREAIEKLERKSATGRLRGLVLDLRNNSGGLLQEAVRMSDLFLPRGNVVTVRSRNSDDEVYRAESGGDVDLPVVVLVDDGTASAAEIVANAVQENHRGLVIGDRTFGKATVQSLLPPVLGSGYFVKLTIARYYGPMDHTLQVHGVRPDVGVPPDVGGEMPLGFREEDLYDHLPEVPSRSDRPNGRLVSTLEACVRGGGLAEKIHSANPNPAIKFDYQLHKAADWLECASTRVAKAVPKVDGVRHLRKSDRVRRMPKSDRVRQ